MYGVKYGRICGWGYLLTIIKEMWIRIGCPQDIDFFVTLYIEAKRRCAGKVQVLYRMVSVRHRFTILDSLSDTIIDVLRTSFFER